MDTQPLKIVWMDPDFGEQRSEPARDSMEAEKKAHILMADAANGVDRVELFYPSSQYADGWACAGAWVKTIKWHQAEMRED